jgi:hypothetical protein
LWGTAAAPCTQLAAHAAPWGGHAPQAQQRRSPPAPAARQPRRSTRCADAAQGAQSTDAPGTTAIELQAPLAPRWRAGSCCCCSGCEAAMAGPAWQPAPGQSALLEEACCCTSSNALLALLRGQPDRATNDLFSTTKTSCDCRGTKSMFNALEFDMAMEQGCVMASGGALTRPPGGPAPCGGPGGVLGRNTASRAARGTRCCTYPTARCTSADKRARLRGAAVTSAHTAPLCWLVPLTHITSY